MTKVSKLWLIPVLISMACFLASDFLNNLSVVHMFATGKESLLSWQGLAMACSVSSFPLGYFASRIKLLWPVCLVVAAMGGILTILSTNTDFLSRQATAQQFEDTREGLIKERASLLESLDPTDGSKPCKDQPSWCDSQEKERRVAEINKELKSTEVKVDPLTSNNGSILVAALAYLRAFAVPLIVAIFGYLIGYIMRPQKEQKKQETEPKKKNYGSNLVEFKKKLLSKWNGFIKRIRALGNNKKKRNQKTESKVKKEEPKNKETEQKQYKTGTKSKQCKPRQPTKEEKKRLEQAEKELIESNIKVTSRNLYEKTKIHKQKISQWNKERDSEKLKQIKRLNHG